MMDEPERLLRQSPSPLERSLLQEARAYRAAKDIRTHTLAALGLTGVAGSALAWLSAKPWPAKLVLALSALALLGAVPVGYLLLGNRSPHARPILSVELPAPSTLARPSHAGTVPRPTPARAADLPAAIPAAPARASARRNSALRAELAALDGIRATLANGEAVGALASLGEYFHSYPHGRLRLEAEALRIDALAQAGRAGLARRYAKDFLRRHPNSVLTERVRPYAGQ